MAVPKDWSIRLQNANGNISVVGDARAICPHCRNASTFAIRGQWLVANPASTDVHLFLECNYGACKKIVYVYTSVNRSVFEQHSGDPFFMYPSRAVDALHPGIPVQIADDWAEAQRATQACAVKAAAVMCRRVLYGVLMDKNCKLHPLHEGLRELIQGQRLPAIFDEWLPAIKDDGHDAAHPDRVLQVSTDNLMETMEYTSELLRFLYIEPYEYQQRKNRNAAPGSLGAATPSR